MATVVLPSGPAGEFDYLVPAEMVVAEAAGSCAGAGSAGARAAGAGQSERRRVLRGGRYQADGRAEAEGGCCTCSIRSRCCRRPCCG